MSDIRAWLEGLGLGQYVEAFENNDIDRSLLADLTDDDLRNIGVASAGHRIKLRRAIAALDGGAVAAASQPAGTDRPASPEAERRQLTVMFCDLVGSTALSEEMDPENLRTLMADYQKAAGTVIERYDGHVAQYLGDGLMVYFGWPQAHEDDAQRAVRAGLGIVEAVKSVAAPEPLQVRVGIATGPVVVGETGAGDAAVPKAAVGETPNVAARLQALAGPDQIVIAPNTHRLTGGAFDYDDLGEQTLKGVVEPQRVWRVRGESQAEDRFEARTAGGLTPFVGRETEVAMLLDRWVQAKDGEGQAVLLEGEPGIGKSRIARELRERLAGEPHTRLRYQCSPYHTASAFYPIVDQLERAAGFRHDDTTDAKLDKLESLLAQGADEVPKTAPLMASMLALSTERYPPIDLSPQRQKDETIAALAAEVAALASRQPVLMLVEDVHWCDPTTIETLSAVIAAIDAAPVLAVITYRPEFDPPWTGHGHVTVQSLSRLGRRRGADMVNRVTGGKSLPDEVLDQIVAKTDGVPLFVEELTKTVLEAGFLEDAGDHYEIDGQVPALAIPSTLQDSLMARLDRLSPVRELAQTGACIGREFSYELLRAVSPLRENELQDALIKLVDSELVFRRGAPPEATYTFKHALVQDAAYESLLKSRRRELHARIAKFMLDNDFNATSGAPEMVAHHFTQSEQFDKAVPYWLKAGQKALMSTALPEAVSHLNNALKLVDRLPPTGDRDHQELEIRVALGGAYMTMLGWAAPDGPRILEPARNLCKKLGQIDRLLAVQFFIWMYYCNICNVSDAFDIVNDVLALEKTHGGTAITLLANSIEGQTQALTGNYEKTTVPDRRVSEVYDFDAHHDMAGIYGHDIKCLTLIWAGAWRWALGWPDRARDAAIEQLELSRRIGHPFNLVSALTIGGWALMWRRETAEWLEWMDEAREVGRHEGMAFVEHVVCPFNIGFALAAAGKFAEGYANMAGPAELWRGAGAKNQVPLTCAVMARAAAAMGNSDEAASLMQDALEIIDESGHRQHEAECRRLNGEILMLAGDEEQAAASYIAAIDIAKGQQTKSFELRAAISLAQLWHDQGKTAAARELLTPVYDWFTEGFDTHDLKAAKALLEDLA